MIWRQWQQIQKSQLLVDWLVLLLFCCVSKRFRRQLIYVLFKVHINSFQKLFNKMKNNQITPRTDSVVDEQSAKPSITVHDIALRVL